jgi:hypothetical protein
VRYESPAPKVVLHGAILLRGVPVLVSLSLTSPTRIQRSSAEKPTRGSCNDEIQDERTVDETHGGENSAIGLLENPARDTIWSYPRTFASVSSENVAPHEGDGGRRGVAEPEEVHDVNAVPAIEKTGDERGTDAPCPSCNEDIHDVPFG